VLHARSARNTERENNIFSVNVILESVIREKRRESDETLLNEKNVKITKIAMHLASAFPKSGNILAE